MAQHINDLFTPTIMVNAPRLQANINRMQAVCDAHGVGLWPHIKTHKMVPVAKMQLAAGARGLVCAKLSEAEVMLASGVRNIFIAHSIIDARLSDRLKVLSEKLDELILAATNSAQVQALAAMLSTARVNAQILVGVDTGLGREGTRSQDEAARVVDFVRKNPTMTFRGFYTHEGHSYSTNPGSTDACIQDVVAQLTALREKVGEPAEIWPGCSVTAERMAQQKGVTVVRPGTYVFGDLSLSANHHVMKWEDQAATVLTTVVDRPTNQLALVDAGSKTLSGDRTADGLYASMYEAPHPGGRNVHVTRCSEEHGWMTGDDVGALSIGDRIQLIPAHICPAINLANEVNVVDGEQVIDRWRVDARGCVQ